MRCCLSVPRSISTTSESLTRRPSIRPTTTHTYSRIALGQGSGQEGDAEDGGSDFAATGVLRRRALSARFLILPSGSR